MSEEPEQTTKKFNPAAMILLTAIAWVYFGSVLPFGLFSKPNMPEEFKAVFVGSNFLSVSALLALFNGDSPLYYALAHFACFFSNPIFALKTLSYIFVSAAAFGAMLLVNELNDRAGAKKTFFVAIYAALLPLVYLGFLAIPGGLSLCTLVLSFLFLVRMMHEPTPWRRSLYIASTAAFCFSCHFGFLVPVLQYVIYRIAGKNSGGENKTFLSVFFWALASAATSAFAFHKASVYSVQAAGLMQLVLGQFATTTGSPGIVLYCLLSIMFCAAILVSNSGEAKGNPMAVVLFAVSVLTATALAVMNPVLTYSRNEINSHNRFVVSLLEQRLPAGHMLVAAIPGTMENYYMLRESAHLPMVFIYPEPLKTDYSKLDLGSDLGTAKKYESRNPPNDLLVKEALPGAKMIHVIGDSESLCNGGAGSREIGSIMPYLEPSAYQPNTAIDCAAPEPGKLYYASYVIKEGVSRDGILLSLLVNDYADAERAARLITDDTFEPGGLSGYFEGVGDAAAAVVALHDVCAGDAVCRKNALDKAVDWAVAQTDVPLRETILKAALPLYDEILKEMEEAGGDAQ